MPPAPTFASTVLRAPWTRRLMLVGIAAAGLFAAVFAMQALQGEHQPFSKMSQWYTGPPPPASWQPVDPAHIKEVDPSKATDALSLLQERPFIALSKEGYELLTAERSLPASERSPFLIRALQLSRYVHEPQAHVSPTGEVWVNVEVVSRWPLPMLERPLILWLQAPPREVFVDARVYQSAPAAHAAD